MIKVPRLGQTFSEFSTSPKNSELMWQPYAHPWQIQSPSVCFYMVSMHHHFTVVLRWVRNYLCLCYSHLYTTHMCWTKEERKSWACSAEVAPWFQWEYFSVEQTIWSLHHPCQFITHALTIILCMKLVCKVEAALSRFYLGKYFPFSKWLCQHPEVCGRFWQLSSYCVLGSTWIETPDRSSLNLQVNARKIRKTPPKPKQIQKI